MARPLVTPAGARAELAARESYGRLLAVLAAPTRDIAAAEDALADAFERALRTWPETGVPDSPEAWLLTVARHRQRDEWGSAARRTSVPLEASDPLGDPGASLPLVSVDRAPIDPASIDPDAVPDKRLELLFVCAHPAIDSAMRTPLMLQTVLGFDATQVATAFALPAPTMAQRLVRVKRRIRDAGIPFAVPTRSMMPTRLPPVLEAVYGCYAIDWQRVSGETLRDSLSGEALYLATTLAQLLPAEAEVHGLAALICLSLARADARTSPSGEHVPLTEQDTALWDAALIARGEAHLRRAHALALAPPVTAEVPARSGEPGGPPVAGAPAGASVAPASLFGRFQLEAAMQSVHCDRAVTGQTDWGALRALNEALVRVAPTLGAQVSLAATIAEVEGPEAGLAQLDALASAAAAGTTTTSATATALARFQPAWATRAHLLAAAGRSTEARAAYAKAISLTTDARLRAHLQARAGE